MFSVSLLDEHDRINMQMDTVIVFIGFHLSQVTAFLPSQLQCPSGGYNFNIGGIESICKTDTVVGFIRFHLSPDNTFLPSQ